MENVETHSQNPPQAIDWHIFPVGLENSTMLGYPVFGGWAINAVIAGGWQALLYALVVF